MTAWQWIAVIALACVIAIQMTGCVTLTIEPARDTAREELNRKGI